MTQQPDWKCIGHIGDVDPIAHGGGFVYVDTTGVYAPEVTLFEPAPDEDWHKTEGKTPVTVYRFILERPRNEEWFVKDLPEIARYCGQDSHRYLLRGLLSKDPMRRAMAYEDIVGYFGPGEFDQYPLTMTEDEAYARYAAEMRMSLSRETDSRR